MNTECLVAVMMIKEARISETSAKICRAICHISEYSHIHIRRRENLKSHESFARNGSARWPICFRTAM